MRPFSERLTWFIALMAIVMGFVSATCFMALTYYIFKSPLEVHKVEGDLIQWILVNFHTPITLLFSALFAGLFGVFFLRLAKASLAHIIPPEDRDLLGKLISKESGAEGINLYIRLSSLRGFSGTFSQLGITGLPLATIGLTLIFALLSIWISDQQGPNGAFLDLAKLTLGAFIGSFVQRQIAPEIPKAEADKRLAAEKAEADRLAAEKAEADRLAAEKAEAERLKTAETESEETASKGAEVDRLPSEKPEVDRTDVEEPTEPEK